LVIIKDYQADDP